MLLTAEAETKDNVIINSYALVKANWLQDDFISSFSKMAISLIKKKSYDVINVETFDKDFEAEYGFRIPHYPSIRLLSLLQRDGYIRFDETSRQWYAVVDEIGKVNIDDQRAALYSKIEEVINDLIAFSASRFSETLSADKAEQILTTAIQANSASILDGNPTNIQTTFKNRSMVAQYIYHVFENDKDKFNVIKQISVGKLLVDAISLIDSDESVSVDFHNATIYLDTRIILNLIGFYGEYRQLACIELITLLNENNALLKMFTHTLREVNNILHGCEKWIDSVQYDPEKASSALRYLKSAGKDQKYVQGLRAYP